RIAAAPSTAPPSPSSASRVRGRSADVSDETTGWFRTAPDVEGGGCTEHEACATRTARERGAPRVDEEAARVHGVDRYRLCEVARIAQPRPAVRHRIVVVYGEVDEHGLLIGKHQLPSHHQYVVRAALVALERFVRCRVGVRVAPGGDGIQYAQDGGGVERPE